MSFKLIPQGEEPDGESRYGLWSTRADGFVLEDATRAALREWAEDAPEGADVPDAGELIATAERGPGRYDVTGRSGGCSRREPV